MRRLQVIADTDNVRADVCRECGGACCRTSPGLASPDDFGAPDAAMLRERVARALDSGRWVIDTRSMVVRPAVREREGVGADDNDRGACTFWTIAGCSIFESRPTGCRMLVPAWSEEPGEACESDGDLRPAWALYADVLRAVLAARA